MGLKESNMKLGGRDRNEGVKESLIRRNIVQKDIWKPLII